MRNAILLFIVALLVGLSGCGKASRLQRHVSRGDAAFEKRDFETARIEYMNALRLNPNQPRVHSRLGLSFYELGETVDAVRFLVSASKANPNDLAARSKLGLILSSMGDCTNAAPEIEAVLQKIPADGDSLLALAGCATTTNQIDAALVRMTHLLSSHETNAQLHLAMGFLHQKRQDIPAAEKAYLRAQALDPKSSKPPFALAGIYWTRGDTNAAEAALTTASELAPVKSSERLRLAEFKMRSGNSAEARKVLEDAIEKAPDFVPAINVLAELAMNEGRTNDCTKLLAQALKKAPKDRTARLLKGRLKLQTGDRDAALTLFEGLTQDFPQDSFSFYQLGLAQAAKRESARAVASLDRALTLRPTFPEALLLRAELLMQSGNSAGAIPTLVTLTTRYPNLPRPFLLLADAYRLQGNSSEAFHVYELMAKAFPKDPRPLYLRGVLRRQLGNMAEARKAYDAALQMEPDYLAAIDEIIELDIQENKFTSALERIDSYIKKYPDKPMPLLLQAKVLNAQKKLSETEAALQKAVALDPDFIFAQRFLVEFYINSDQKTNAIKRLEAMLEKNDKDPIALLQLGLIYEAAENWNKARENYEKVLSVRPNNPVALNNLAYVLTERFNDLDKALGLAQRARDLAPLDPAAADTLGWILYRRGDHQRALAVLQQAAEKAAGNPEIAYHLGMAHYVNGNEAEAIQALTVATAPNAKAFPQIDKAKSALAILTLNPATATDKDIEALNAASRLNQRDLFAQIRLAEVLAARKDFNGARQKFEVALGINSNSVPALRHLAALEIEHLNNPAKGVEYAKRAWEIQPSPGNAKAIGRLGILTGQFKWALPVLEQAYQAQREDAESTFLLAYALYTRGVLDRPSDLLRPLDGNPKAASLAPQISAMLAMLKAHNEPVDPQIPRPVISALEANQYTKAAAMLGNAIAAEDPKNSLSAQEKYQTLISSYPEFVLAQKLFAVFAEKANQDAVAAPLIAKVRPEFPNDPTVLRAAGRVAYRQKDYSEAARALRAASRTYANDADLLYHLGLAQFHLSEKSAKETLTRALALDSSSPKAAEAKGALAKIQ